jgi:N-acetylmuramoyl-L-alanine amidase
VPAEDGLPLVRGATGVAVGDLQRRLQAAGFVVDDEVGVYGPATEAAVHRFQQDRGLNADGTCGNQTWASLVEAGWRLGDRFLYLRRPMLRGDDVADLQARLGSLGFHHGRVDGIFGPDSADAVREFQRNTGLVADAIYGRDTNAALARLSARASATALVGDVRDRVARDEQPRQLSGRRVVVGETGGLDALATAVARTLTAAGAVVAVLHHPDGSVQATEANQFAADCYLGVHLRDDAGCTASYFGTARWESPGGRALAKLVADEVAADGPLVGVGEARAMTVPVLRETRMPAVICEVGPPPRVVSGLADLAERLGRAIGRWAEAPSEA